MPSRIGPARPRSRPVAEGPEHADVLGCLEASVDARHPPPVGGRWDELHGHPPPVHLASARLVAGEDGQQVRVLDATLKAEVGGAAAEPEPRDLPALGVVPAGVDTDRAEVVVLAPAPEPLRRGARPDVM